ncbi:hypothetical protein CSKR_104396 [Clonorchis sinensis]|uniref:Uncharacterized protein n=2 Tax=Clonorchis sinensis TaxID=79923 RepID=A0A8T1MWN8_CLOSI|nr:hypothetical protein CSKR_104396 [Clonorchis sinensis]GAA53133.1 hypothetical protein CLF_109614 [Clonorchis sinensis]
MLQATASLIAEARGEEQGRLLPYMGTKREGSSVASYPSKRDYQRRIGYSFTARLRNRVCSDSCLKFVYLSCATLVSASFIIECILLHLIVVPYLSESVFEPGICKYNGSRRDDSPKKCENKCSKERSSFPCLQIRVVFTPLYVDPNLSHHNQTSDTDDRELSATLESVIRKQLDSPFASHWIPQQNENIPANARYNFSSPESRVLYLYDYFSTFAAHKASRCSTSPCHRREEDNKDAVEDFKRVLWRQHIFLCYARPRKASHSTEPHNQVADINPPGLDTTTTSTILGPEETTQTPVWPRKDPKDAAAIIYRLYTPTMFFHSLCWPGGIFLSALVILLFTYLADGCQAWARDKTVIA